MAERQILFSGPMVRAILDGRKTQTRRVIKYNNELPRFIGGAGEEKNPAHYGWECDGARGIDWLTLIASGATNEKTLQCPYGKPGDRLWVRETWAYSFNSDMDVLWNRDYLYRATDGEHTVNRWKPSIHMPRKASRITLEITNIRVERVQEISDTDISAEGLNVTLHPGNIATGDVELPNGTYRHSTARYCFESLWDSINGTKVKKSGRTITATRNYPWSLNPWVWVITFKKLESEARA